MFTVLTLDDLTTVTTELRRFVNPLVTNSTENTISTTVDRIKIVRANLGPHRDGVCDSEDDGSIKEPPDKNPPRLVPKHLKKTRRADQTKKNTKRKTPAKRRPVM
jgi:hypothetical protein